jgi:hypothetical protein
MVVRVILLLTAVAAFVGTWTGDHPGRQAHSRSVGTVSLGSPKSIRLPADAPRTATGPVGEDAAIVKRAPMLSARQQTYAAQSFRLRCLPERACGRNLEPAFDHPPVDALASSGVARLASIEKQLPAAPASAAPLLPSDAEPDGFRLVTRLRAGLEIDRSFIVLSRPPLPLIATSPKRDPLQRFPSIASDPKRTAADVARERVYR